MILAKRLRDEVTAKNALALLETVPENEWIVGLLTDYHGACCALGHMNRLTSSNPHDYSGSNCDKNSDKFMFYDEENGPIYSANDGSARFPGTTPKERTINHLKAYIARHER